MHIHRTSKLFRLSGSCPAESGWETVSPEEFNGLRASGWEPSEYTPIPRAISNADLRRGLIALGINPALITGYLNSLPEGAAKWAAVSDWEYANYFERAHPLIDQLAPAFGLTSADVDALFKSKPEYPLIAP